MDSSNVIVKCLGRTLKTEIKLVVIVYMKCLDAHNKDIENPKNDPTIGLKKKIICLATEQIYILDDNIEKIFDNIPYHLLDYLEIDKKSKDGFFLHIKPNYQMIKNDSIVKINIKSEFRGMLIKNFMCYYSIYYMHKHFTVKKLPLINEKVETKSKDENEKSHSKYKQRSLKSYNFFFPGFIQKEYNNVYFKIKYDSSQLDKKEVKEKYTTECEINIDISDLIHLNKFDLNKDARDISSFANQTFQNYMLNTLKINKYWVLKNKTYNKKFNLMEDSCVWEGWIIESRIHDPIKKNFIFIFLRRKFIPPNFDSFQNFLFVLSENYTDSCIDINPSAHKLIEMISNSIHSTLTHSSAKEYNIFIKAKIDSLLVDEETLYYYQFSEKIIGHDIYKFGYDFLYTLMSYFEYSMKEKIEPFKAVLVNKFKQYEFDQIDKWKFEKKIYCFLEKINCYINSSINQKRFLNNTSDLGFNKENSKKNDAIKNEYFDTTPHTLETEDDKGWIDKKFITNNLKESQLDNEKLNKVKRNWTIKVMRFLTYCLNGGLTDFMMTYEKFLMEFFYKNQSTNNDLEDLIFQTSNIIDLENNGEKITKEKVGSITDNSNLYFNEDALCVLIRTGFLGKLLSDNMTAFPKFLSVIILKYCTNKILNAIFEYLKLSSDLVGDDMVMSDERKPLIHLITPLAMIFTDKRKNHSTICLSCKCLCLLAIKKSDDVFRKKIAFQSDLINSISTYLEVYNFDERIVLCCLDLFVLIMNESELTLTDYLYGYPCLIFDKLKRFFEPTGIPGTYYSQRIIIKVLTIFLNLTNKIEAEVKPRINSQYIKIFDQLIRLVKDGEKCQVIDPKEEESYILEFKVYWLMCILTFKNNTAKDYLKQSGINLFIEEKSKKFMKILQLTITTKNTGISESKITAISKNISKFFEFVYYYMIIDKEDVIKLKNELTNFNLLKKKVVENKNLLLFQDKETSVFDMIEKLYKMAELEF